MNRKIRNFLLSITVFVLIFFSAVFLTLYLQKESRPVVFCGSLDDSIRPRNYCLMNPFRDRQPERLAEEILRELRNGNSEAIIPYLNDDQKNRILENEKKYQIKNWRIGHRENTEDSVFIMYWVSRQNYYQVENVNFYFVREGNNWKLKNFNAIY